MYGAKRWALLVSSKMNGAAQLIVVLDVLPVNLVVAQAVIVHQDSALVYAERNECLLMQYESQA